jgi:hypothetical protein
MTLYLKISAPRVGLPVGAGTTLLLFSLVVPFTRSKIKAHKGQKDERKIFQAKSWAVTPAIGIAKLRYWWKDDHILTGSR